MDIDGEVAMEGLLAAGVGFTPLALAFIPVPEFVDATPPFEAAGTELPTAPATAADWAVVFFLLPIVGLQDARKFFRNEEETVGPLFELTDQVAIHSFRLDLQP